MGRRVGARLFAFPLLLLGAGCGTSVFIPANHGAITAVPSSIALTAIGSSASTMLGRSNATASGCASSIVSTSIVGTTLTVTATGVGTCTLTISAPNSANATIPVVVTTSAVTGS